MQRFILSLAAAVVVAAGIPSAIHAQEYESTPVTISSEKLKINGQVCYSHIVLERQTLFSICKAYNVTTEELYKFNPSLKEKGLQKNSILIIPVSEVQDNVADHAPEVIAQEAEPVKEVVPHRIHTVKWFEDMDMIVKKYGISAETIIKVNGMTGKKLEKRQKLIIPYSEDAEVLREKAEDLIYEHQDTLQVADSVSEKHADIVEGMFFPKKDISLSLLLPFKANGTSGSTGNMDFYSGALLAVYDSANNGISCELNVYDTGNSEEQISHETLQQSDIIIGPVSTSELKSVLESEPEVKGVISPLDQKAASLAETFTNMIQAPTPLALQYKDLIDWIKEDLQDNDRFLVITEKGGTQTEATVQMKAAADSSGIEYKDLAYSILEGRNVTGSLEYLMTESGTNRVYIASDSEAFVNDVVRNLNVMLYMKYDVVLYAPSRIRNYETIEVENFHNASLHVSTGYFIDYNNPKVQEFLLKYRALYNTEPTQFAFQGYDLAKYFIDLCTKYGNRWNEMLDNSDVSMLQSTFRFRKTGEGGYINTGIRRIIYEDDWTLVNIK